VTPLGFEKPGIEAITGSLDEIAEALAAFASIGVSHLQVVLTRTTPAALEAFAPVLEVLRTRAARPSDSSAL
jgi:hypothetical protein